jgi:glutaconate CoA-transferase subunit B
MRFRPSTRAIYLASYHPGLSPEESAENTGFPLDIEGATETAIPTPGELRILREQVGPERVFLN